MLQSYTSKISKRDPLDTLKRSRITEETGRYCHSCRRMCDCAVVDDGAIERLQKRYRNGVYQPENDDADVFGSEIKQASPFFKNSFTTPEKQTLKRLPSLMKSPIFLPSPSG